MKNAYSIELMKLVVQAREIAGSWKSVGDDQSSWECSAYASSLLNKATISALSTGNFTPDEELFYTEVPGTYELALENKNKKGINLNISLGEGSDLAKRIEAILREDMGGE